MRLSFPLQSHHLIEFISVSELAFLLEQLGSAKATITTGPNYVLYCQSDILFFFTAKTGSCHGEWNDTNCTEHLVIYAIMSGLCQNRYELALSHMSLTTLDLKQVLQNYINLMISPTMAHETQRNECRVNSHNERLTLESIQAAFQFQYSA